MKAKKKITWSRAIWQAVFGMIIVGFIFLISTIFLETRSAEGGAFGNIDFSVSQEDNIYSGPPPELGKQGKGKIIIPKKMMRELHIIGNVIYWSNWNFTNLYPGIFKYRKPNFCTVYFDKSLANSFPWYMYSFVFLKEPMYPDEIEEYISKKFNQGIIGIVRIDRRPDGFAVAYIRNKNDHKAIGAKEVDGFPYLPETLEDNVNFSGSAITFKIEVVENISQWGKKYYDDEFDIPFQDIFMVNPTFFGDPKRLGNLKEDKDTADDVIIPYSHFAKKEGFIYYYQEIAIKISNRIEPMVIEFSPSGVRFRFYKTSRHRRL